MQPEQSLRASAAIDFVAREEFDFTLAEVAEGRPLASIAGISFTGTDGRVVHNPDRETLEDMDLLPFVTPVYRRDLRPEHYYIGYLLHRTCRSTPAAAAGHGARSACGPRRWAATGTGPAAWRTCWPKPSWPANCSPR